MNEPRISVTLPVLGPCQHTSFIHLMRGGGYIHVRIHSFKTCPAYSEWHIHITRYIHAHVTQDHNHLRCIAEMCVHPRAPSHAAPATRGAPPPDHRLGTGLGPPKPPTCTPPPGRRDHPQKAEPGRASLSARPTDVSLSVWVSSLIGHHSIANTRFILCRACGYSLN